MKKLIKQTRLLEYVTTVILFLSVVLLCTVFIVIANAKPCITDIEYSDIAARDMYVELPEISKDPIELSYVDCEYQPVLVTYYEMELTSIGTYYLTAYCPWECGYNGYNYPAGWRTASGEICHRADWNHRLSEPTTCAISRSIHSFGDEFYIAEFDRTFIAEDTGPGVQGKHLDLFYEDYEEMASFPTGYYEVYAVTWVEKTVVASEEDLEYLLDMPATEYYWKRN